MTTTNTPRTDDAAFGSMTDSLSRQLERELAAYKAEVELAASKAEVEFWKAKAYEAEFYERKHEAEVDRLEEELDNIKASTIHTCHEKCKRPMCQLRRELAKSKALCSVQYKAIQRLEKEAKPEYWKEKAFSYCERAEKAEAEVERLREIIESL